MWSVHVCAFLSMQVRWISSLSCPQTWMCLSMCPVCSSHFLTNVLRNQNLIIFLPATFLIQYLAIIRNGTMLYEQYVAAVLLLYSILWKSLPNTSILEITVLKYSFLTEYWLIQQIFTSTLLQMFFLFISLKIVVTFATEQSIGKHVNPLFTFWTFFVKWNFFTFFLYNHPCECHKVCSHFPSKVASYDTFLVRSLLHMHTLTKYISTITYFNLQSQFFVIKMCLPHLLLESVSKL